MIVVLTEALAVAGLGTVVAVAVAGLGTAVRIAEMTAVMIAVSGLVTLLLVYAQCLCSRATSVSASLGMTTEDVTIRNALMSIDVMSCCRMARLVASAILVIVTLISPKMGLAQRSAAVTSSFA